MTVECIRKVTSYLPWEFVGLSTDAKPTEEDIPAGSEFTAVDTGETFKLNGAIWYPFSKRVSIIGSPTSQITFQSAATIAGNGASLSVGGLKSLTVGITSAGGNTARIVEFRGIDIAGNDNLITGVNKNGLSPATSTAATGETWQFDITGLVAVYMKLTAITAGNVTVAGLAVV